jgi:hypothetical protein
MSQNRNADPFITKSGLKRALQIVYNDINKLQGDESGGNFRINKVNNPLVVPQNSEVILTWNFTSLDSATQEPNGDGTATYTVNNKVINKLKVKQSTDYKFDITSYLVLGTNTIVISVIDAYGSTRKATYEIEVVAVELKSAFDATEIFEGDIKLYYTPIGKAEKTIYFSVDGKEIGRTTTSLTGYEDYYIIPKLTHGTHNIEISMDAIIGDLIVESKPLSFDIICIEEGNNTPIVKATVIGEEFIQSKNFETQFQIYDPKAIKATLNIEIDGELVSTQVVDRTLNSFVYKPSEAKEYTLEFICGTTSKTIVVDVEPLSIDVSAESRELELFLSPQGRTNSDLNRTEWNYGTINGTLTNFNFVNDGWMTDDDGNTCLRVTGDAKVTIPYKPFSKDFKTSGKTIEFEFSSQDIEDYEVAVISSMYHGKGIEITPQIAKFASELSSVSTQYKENERVRVSFVIQNTREYRLILMYLNGILSGVTQYPENDTFSQTVPQDITIYSPSSVINIYGIRIYQTSLDERKILNNYIFDMDDVDKKVDVYTDNQIYNAYNEVEYNKLVEQIPCMTLVGALPSYKGDKVYQDVVYENRQDPSKSFTAKKVRNDVQGTSSQYYPRKNYKFKFDKTEGLIMTESGKQQSKYALRDGELAISTICLKADFAESSGVHNTGMAKLIHNTLKELELYTPAQKQDIERGDTLSRTTVDGFPICVFHQETEDSDRIFLGKYNFNSDKANDEYYGFRIDDFPECEFIELCNNNSSRVVFTYSDYDEMIEKNGSQYPAWLDDFEFRFPDDDDLNAEYESGEKKPLQLKRLTDWLATTTNNPEKFKSEAKEYFDIDYLIFYYVVTELFAMVDQRAKNMFLTTWDGIKWYCIFYDNDTVCGVDNNGIITFGFGVEYYDKQDGLAVWNDKSLSNIWVNVEQAYSTEIRNMYLKVRDVLSYDVTIDYLNKEQSDKWCESIYNEDAKYKYIEPLTDGYYDGATNQFLKTGEFLPRAQGSRAEHRKWWLYNRFYYMDSKYNAKEYTGDYITMRVNVPTLKTNPETEEDELENKTIRETLSAVPSDPGFNITAYVDQYARVKYEGTIVDKRGYKNKPVRLDSPKNFVFSDTNTIVYGVSRITDLGDLAPKYLTYFSASKAKSLLSLKIGDEDSRYYNNRFKTLELKECTLLKNIDLRNCSGLGLGDQKTLDLQGCNNLKEIYATGTSLEAITFNNGGYLEKVHLPNTIKNLTIEGHTNLKEVELEGAEKVTTLILENNGMDYDSGDVLTKVMDESTVLNKVRVIDLDNSGEFSADTLYDLYYAVKGIGDDGKETNYPVLKGTVPVVTTDIEGDKALLEPLYPDLEFTWLSLDNLIFEEVEIDGVEGYAVSAEKIIEITDGKLIIPKTHKRKPILEVRDFSGLKELTYIQGMDNSNIRKISKEAMLGTGITEIKTGKALRYLDLTDCHQVTSVNGLENGILFEDHSNIRTVTTNSSVINNFVFKNCSNFTEVNYREDNENISLEITGCKSYDSYKKVLLNYTMESNIKYLTLDSLENKRLGEMLDEKNNWLTYVHANCIEHNLYGTLIYTYQEDYVFDEEIIRETYPNIIFTFKPYEPSYGFEITVTDVNKDAAKRTVEFVCELKSIFSGEKECIFDWGDDTETVINFTYVDVDKKQTVTHEYKEAGDYVIKIVGGSGIAKSLQTDTEVLFNEIYIDQLTTEIEEHAFSYNSKLGKITIPERITKIGDSAFHECTNIEIDKLPDGLITLGHASFQGCRLLNLKELPETLESIGSFCFFFNYNLSLTKLPSKLKEIADYTFFDNKKLVLESLPEGITKIGQSAFSGCNILPLKSIPKNVTYIGSSAFASCYEIDFDSLPSGLTSIGAYSFYSCYALSLKELPPNIETIDPYAFERCEKLELTSLPKTVTYIGEKAFNYCTKLPLDLYDHNIVTIHNNAFGFCENLKRFKFNNSIKYFGLNIFMGTTLQEFHIEKGIDFSYMQCFFNNTTISNGILVIPSNVEMIDANAFNLTGDFSLYLTSQVPPTLTLGDNLKRKTIFVPKGTSEIYKTSTNWSAYADQIQEWTELPSGY